MRARGWVISLVASVLLNRMVSADPHSTPDGLALAIKVQHFYEKTKDFKADFDQSYRYAAMERTQKSSGTMEVKKPGYMRWDYVKPNPKLFVLDGKALYTYDPDDNSVTVKKNFSSDALPMAVTFLWGKGKLSDEFDLSQVERPDYGPVVLELMPRKTQPGVSRLFFVVDPETGTVTTSVIFDSEGNENRITFSNVKVNTGIADGRFSFQIPKGADVKEL
jgi:outer membrane lipoprotein carrier protein